MSLNELTADQKLALKQTYLCQMQENTSWGELADADILVSDEELEDAFGGVDFVEDDFFTDGNPEQRD